jgi:hypothetical protein
VAVIPSSNSTLVCPSQAFVHPPHGTRAELAIPLSVVDGDDPACPIDSEVNAAMVTAIDALREAGTKVEVHPAALPVSIAENHRVFESLV